MTGPATEAPNQKVTEDDAKSAAARMLASVLDLPGLAAVAEPMVAPFGKALLALAEPLDAISSLSGVARRLLDVVASEVAREEPTVQMAIERNAGATGEPAAPPPDPTPPPWPQLIADLVEELAEHADAADMELRREARSALRELAEQITGLRAMAVGGPGGKVPREVVERVAREIAKRADKLKKILNRLEKLFGKISTPRFRIALKLLEVELSGAARHRGVLAATLSVPGFALDVGMAAGSGARERPSSRSLGTEVHEHLQREYRSYWLSSRFPARRGNPFVRNVVVQDGNVYYNAMLGAPLANAAKSRRDGSLYALLFARFPERVARQLMGGERMDRVWSMYREDTLDLTCGEVWEIKPVRSAAIGVYQELQYRHAFNLVNALMLDVRDLIAAGVVTGRLRRRAAFFRGLYFSREVPLIPGLDTNWAPIKRAFVVGQDQGRALLAVPMTVPQLPGLLLYVLLELPAVALLALSGVLAGKIAELLEKVARDYVKFVEEVLEVLARIALAALAALAVLVVVVLFWEALAAGGIAQGLAALAQLIARFAPVLAAGAALSPGPVAPDPAAGSSSGDSPSASRDLPSMVFDLARKAKLKPLAPPAVVGDDVVVQLAQVQQEKGAPVSVIDVTLGHVRVCGLPASAEPIVEALAQIGAAVAAGAFAEFLGEQEGQA